MREGAEPLPLKDRLSQNEFIKPSILQNSNWKFWRISALASKMRSTKSTHTCKSLSEALILASTNPKYDKRLFTELPVFSTRKLHVQNMLCTQIVLNVKTKTKWNLCTCSELVVFLYWTGNSMNNLFSYCGLVVARIIKCFWQRFTCTQIIGVHFSKTLTFQQFWSTWWTC